MTLKEKIEEVKINKGMANELEKIADDYAIEFSEWIRKETIHEPLLNKFIYKRNIYQSEKELLEIFKKEKGL